jgi:hypothetical protein
MGDRHRDRAFLPTLLSRSEWLTKVESPSIRQHAGRRAKAAGAHPRGAPCLRFFQSRFTLKNANPTGFDTKELVKLTSWRGETALTDSIVLFLSAVRGHHPLSLPGQLWRLQIALVRSRRGLSAHRAVRLRGVHPFFCQRTIVGGAREVSLVAVTDHASVAELFRLQLSRDRGISA